MRIEIFGEITKFHIMHKGEEMTSIIDTKNLENILLISSKWHISKTRHKYYVQHKGVSIHRYLLNTKKGMMVDHMDGDGLNNREENLREVTNSQNQQNLSSRKASNKSTGIRGVSLDKRRGTYVAQARIDGKLNFLGSFTDPLEAEKAVIKFRAENMPYSHQDSANYLETKRKKTKKRIKRILGKTD